MTGLEALREEMMSRGCSKQQCDSKVVAVILDIVSGSGDKYVLEWNDEKEINEKIRKLEEQHNKLLDQLKRERAKLEGWINELDRRRDEFIEYQKAFNDGLANMETAEGRDVLRTAQLFIESTEIKTAYDNTAFIYGLGAIMSKGILKMPDRMRKVGTIMPEFTTWNEVRY